MLTDETLLDMFSRKNWVSGGLWKPKNPHSLEHLKYLYGVLTKNQTVTEQNRALLVESLRSISEILIWGDQNDSTVFDFFLEKNMLSFFLQFMKQKYGRFICVQLLQTLNILFENISNETSVYYLLSNNHVNSIIVHKFDFSDEEVMAYYISFLKTLSLRLNKHTIHFFYNEHTNDFPLYTEGIKFFNHSESMVRIAVRTITLNVYKVGDKSMLRYIRDKTAAPYFSNLVWFIGKNVLDIDACVRHDTDHKSKDRLADIVAEHLDHLHYLNDILCLNIDALNEVLTDHLLNNLFLPLYVYSLLKTNRYELRSEERPHVSPVVSLFLLSQVFLIMKHAALVRQLADIIFNSDVSIFESAHSASPQLMRHVRGFIKPRESLAKTLDKNRGTGGTPMKRPNYRNDEDPSLAASDTGHNVERVAGNSTFYQTPGVSGEVIGEREEEGAEGRETAPSIENATESATNDQQEGETPGLNQGQQEPTTEASGEISASETVSTEQGDVSDVSSVGEMAERSYHHLTDDEKLASQGAAVDDVTPPHFSLRNRPYLMALFKKLDCKKSDYGTLFSLCLLYALGHNQGLDQELLDTILLPAEVTQNKTHYNTLLMEHLISLLNKSCTSNSIVRLATLELCIKLLVSMVVSGEQCYLQDCHLAAVEGAREEATLLLRNFYKSEEIFLDMFEDEYREMHLRPLNVEYLTMDASILLPPTGTPLTGIDFIKRLPCGEVERARRAIRVFFYLRELSLRLQHEDDHDLPLTRQEECVKVGDVLDLNNSDLIACTVVSKDQSKKERRFLVIDVLQLILVEPDSRKLGWGLVKFVGFLQDVEVTGDKEDSRSLYITIHKPTMCAHARPLPLLSARFMFDDHIRCMAAKQRLTKGRLKARQRKMQMIARLLELPANLVSSLYTQGTQSGGPSMAQTSIIQHASSPVSIPGRSHQVKSRPQSEVVKRSVFAGVEQTPAFTGARVKQHRQNAARNLPGLARRRTQAGGARRTMPSGAVAGEIEIDASQQPQSQHIDRGGSGGIASPAIGAEDVEQAVEAEASLRSENIRQKRLSKYYGSQSDEIQSSSDAQLDEMSAKASKLLWGTRELFKDSRQQMSKSPQSRSASNSPKRKSTGSNSLRNSRSSSVGSNQSTDGAVGNTEIAKAVQSDAGSSPRRADNRIRRTKSDGPETHKAKTLESAKSLDTDTLLSTARKMENVKNDSEQDSSDDAMIKRPRAQTCPKTLTPAQEPALSLVISCDTSLVPEASKNPALESPHLIPPTDVTRIRSLSEGSNHQMMENAIVTSSGQKGATTTQAVGNENDSKPADSLISDNTANTETTLERNNEKSETFEKDIRNARGSDNVSQSESQAQTIDTSSVVAMTPPFLSKSPPTLSESSISADLSRIERIGPDIGQNVTERLSKQLEICEQNLAAAAVTSGGRNDTGSDIEMTTRRMTSKESL